MPRPASSFYSQDNVTPNNLGYTPFEYWNGPKPVLWPSLRQPNTHRRKHSSSPTASRAPAVKPSSPGAASEPSEFEPIQPSKLYSAQQFVATLQAAKLADTKRDSHNTHVGFLGSRGDIAQFRAAPGDIKPGSHWNSSDKNEKGRPRLAVIHESKASPDPLHHSDHKTAAGVQVSQRELGRSHSTRSSPPAYADLPPLKMKGSRNILERYYGDESDDRWWDFKTWRRRTWAILAAAAAVGIIVIVVVVVMLQKKNAYPSYTRLVYTLSDEYSGQEFFDQFDYFTGDDPTHGFVHYVAREQAAALNLSHAGRTSAVLRVDTSMGNTTRPDASTGRSSVRVTSKRQYNTGSGRLFLFDVRHTPHGCGTWPALWLADPDHWPDNGEIDIMEATNRAAAGNAMTLHTSPGCSMGHRRRMTGRPTHESCASSGASNIGCGVQGPAPTFGSGFNARGGGIMALEWRREGIRMWQFARGSIPADITGGTPDPSTWGTALADFPDTGCDIASHFRNQSIIMNIALCGDLAGAQYADSGCPSNCTDFVATNPQEFVNAYWEVGTFRVYSAS